MIAMHSSVDCISINSHKIPLTTLSCLTPECVKILAIIIKKFE